ncbi:hypothetical protein Sjap_026672 [Stephania japonica]|uniref:Uncharacterized protein n=1 Tax=Stephania japonica TaxID=461633 RepID=A0AAP0DUK9_9MAGN
MRSDLSTAIGSAEWIEFFEAGTTSKATLPLLRKLELLMSEGELPMVGKDSTLIRNSLEHSLECRPRIGSKFYNLIAGINTGRLCPLRLGRIHIEAGKKAGETPTTVFLLVLRLLLARPNNKRKRSISVIGQPDVGSHAFSPVDKLEECIGKKDKEQRFFWVTALRLCTWQAATVIISALRISFVAYPLIVSLGKSFLEEVSRRANKLMLILRVKGGNPRSKEIRQKISGDGTSLSILIVFTVSSEFYRKIPCQSPHGCFEASGLASPLGSPVAYWSGKFLGDFLPLNRLSQDPLLLLHPWQHPSLSLTQNLGLFNETVSKKGFHG